MQIKGILCSVDQVIRKSRAGRKSCSKTQVGSLLVVSIHQWCLRANISIFRKKKDVSNHLPEAFYSFFQELSRWCFNYARKSPYQSALTQENKVSAADVYIYPSSFDICLSGAHIQILFGGCQHALDRLNFSGPTERRWAVRYHWEL